jgi:hypothetical protein
MAGPCREKANICAVSLITWFTSAIWRRDTGGREWESNPPRTGWRPFAGFEVRTPHRRRFPSIGNDFNHSRRFRQQNKPEPPRQLDPSGPKLFRSCSCDRDRAKYSGYVGVCLLGPLDIDTKVGGRVIPDPRRYDMEGNASIQQHCRAVPRRGTEAGKADLGRAFRKVVLNRSMVAKREARLGLRRRCQGRSARHPAVGSS